MADKSTMLVLVKSDSRIKARFTDSAKDESNVFGDPNSLPHSRLLVRQTSTICVNFSVVDETYGF